MRILTVVGLASLLLPFGAAAQFGPVGAEFQVNTYTVSFQSLPAIAAGAGGAFVVAWDSFGQDGYGNGVFGQRYDPAGQTLGTEFQVSVFTIYNERYPAVTVGTGGAFVVVWQRTGGSGYDVFGQRYDSAGQPVGTEFQVNSYTTANRQFPTVAAGADESFVVAWQSYQDGYGYGVFGQRYDSAGQAAGAEFQINSHTLGDQRSPAVAAGADGWFVVAWQSYRDGDRAGVFGQLYDSVGQAVGAEFQVNSYTRGDQDDPVVAVGADGSFVVAWESSHDGDRTGMFGQRYDSAGQAAGTEFQINSYTTSYQYFPALALDADGTFMVAWQSGHDGALTGVFGQRYDSAGQAAGAEFQINSHVPGYQGFPAVAPGADGGFVVAWVSVGQDGDAEGVFGRRFAVPCVGDCARAGAEFQVNSYTPGFQYLPVVAAAADGAFVVVWASVQDGDLSGVFGQRYDSAGRAEGTEFQVNSHTPGYQVCPAVGAGADGVFVVVWESDQDGDGYGVFGQRYDSAGQAAGTEFQVNSFTTNYQRFPAVQVGADGSFVVAWNSTEQDGNGYGVFGQRYDSAGQALGTEFQVNSSTAFVQRFPKLAVGGEGSFAVVWQSDHDGSGYGIFAQRYDSEGQAVDAEFQVNSDLASIQRFPEVAAAGDGAFAVVWQRTKDGSSTGVFGQRYDSAGQAVGTEFQVNSHTFDSPFAPKIAASPDGAFVVVWQGYRDGGITDVFGQRYDSAGQAVGGELQVNSYTANNQLSAAVAAAANGAFVVVWQSIQQDGSGAGIFGQRFTTPAPLATPSQTETATVAPSPTATRTSTPSATAADTPSATATVPAPVVCAGDCSGNGVVSVDELITGVAIALGQRRVDDCSAFDVDDSGQIAIDELVAAVAAALDECSGQGGPTR